MRAHWTRPFIDTHQGPAAGPVPLLEEYIEPALPVDPCCSSVATAMMLEGVGNLFESKTV